MGKKGEQRKPSRGRFAFFFILFLIAGGLLLSWSLPYLIGSGMAAGGNVAVIPVHGIILTERSSSLFGEGGVSSKEIADFIGKADRNPLIDAIVIEVNSPGGSGVAAEEIAEAIKEAEKPTIAYIRDMGLSAGYWVASSADEVMASRFSLVGSIGVIGSYLEFSKLFDKYGVTYQRLVAGEYKDIGTPFRPMTAEEEALFQRQLDILHGLFIDTVAENRGLAREDVLPLATGVYFSGVEAEEKGLIDSTGTPKALKDRLRELIGKEPVYAEFSPTKGLLDLITGAMASAAYHQGQGMGAAIFSRAFHPEVNLFV